MMNEKRFRVNDLVKYDYSEIGEYIDENHTDRPIMNDEVCDLLNEQQATIDQLNLAIDDLLSHTSCDEIKKENEKLTDELLKEMEEKASIVKELEETNKAMYNRLKEQSEIIYQLIQKLKEHITEKELKELMEDCGL